MAYTPGWPTRTLLASTGSHATYFVPASNPRPQPRAYSLHAARRGILKRRQDFVCDITEGHDPTYQRTGHKTTGQ